MKQPPSPLSWLFWPTLIIYTVGILFFLFKMNPELMVQKSLISKLGQQKSEAPLVIPDASDFPQPLNELEFSKEENIARFENSNMGPSELKVKHNLLRVKVFESEDLDDNYRPKWQRTEDKYAIFTNPHRFAFYSKDLELIWSFELEKSSHEFLAPASFSKDFVFLTTSKGRVYSLDQQNGQLRWMLPLDTNLQSSATYFRQHLFFAQTTADSNHFEILKVNASNGTLAWRSQAFPQKLASPISIHVSSRRMLFGTTNGAVVALSTSTGKEIWRFEESPSPVRGAPSIIEDQVLVANDDGMAYGISMKSGKKNWQYELKGPTSSSFAKMPTTDWAAIITDNAYLHVLDRKTGEGRWRYNTFNKKALPIVKAIRLNAESITELELLWRYKGWVFVAPCKDERLCFFNPKEGRIIHRLRLRGTLASDFHFDVKDKSLVALIESGVGPKTFYEKSDENIKLPKWTLGYFLQLKDFQRRAKTLREEAKKALKQEPSTDSADTAGP